MHTQDKVEMRVSKVLDFNGLGSNLDERWCTAGAQGRQCTPTGRSTGSPRTDRDKSYILLSSKIFNFWHGMPLFFMYIAPVTLRYVYA
jgi:hypothetical protein